MQHTPDALMLFAAGFGSRMGEMTANCPKPLINVAGKPLIDHALAIVDDAGISRKVANLHYLPDQLSDHLSRRKDITLSIEADEILETGGGLRQALPLLGNQPVFTLNTDVVWTGQNPLTQLRAAWNAERMDVLQILLPANQATGYAGAGDWLLDAGGRLSRAKGATGYVYLGAQIIRTDRLASIPDKVFSLNRLWDIAVADGRAFGIIHNGGWCDVGRPEGIILAESLLASAHV